MPTPVRSHRRGRGIRVSFARSQRNIVRPRCLRRHRRTAQDLDTELVRLTIDTGQLVSIAVSGPVIAIAIADSIEFRTTAGLLAPLRALCGRAELEMPLG
jgi:hypothetical protein